MKKYWAVAFVLILVFACDRQKDKEIRFFNQVNLINDTLLNIRALTKSSYNIPQKFLDESYVDTFATPFVTPEYLQSIKSARDSVNYRVKLGQQLFKDYTLLQANLDKIVTLTELRIKKGEKIKFDSLEQVLDSIGKKAHDQHRQVKTEIANTHKVIDKYVEYRRMLSRSNLNIGNGK